MRKDTDGEFWHILVGAGVGAAISGSISIASNMIAGNKWNDGLLASLATGAATGGLAASGVGLIGQVAGNAIAGGAQEAVGNRHGASFKSVIAATTVGAIAGIAGGVGIGKAVKKETFRAFKSAKNTYKCTKKANKKINTIKQFKNISAKSYKKTRYLFKQILKDGRKNLLINGIYPAGKAFYQRYHK